MRLFLCEEPHGTQITPLKPNIIVPNSEYQKRAVENFGLNILSSKSSNVSRCLVLNSYICCRNQLENDDWEKKI